VVAGFLFKGLFEKFFGHAAEAMETAQEAATAASHVPGWLPILTLILALGGILLAYLIYQKEAISHERLRAQFQPVYVMLQKKYWMDDIAYFLYRRVLVDGLSVICGWFDRYIVDGIVNFVTWLTRKSGEILRLLQNGVVQDYLYGVIFGLILFILLGIF